jgi:hypothetical protein
MGEGQHRGVKEGPVAFGPLLRAIHEIADNGMTDRAQMQADLVLAPRVEFDFEEGGSGKTLLDAVVCNGVTRRLVVVTRKVAAARDIFIRNWQIDGSGCGPRYPFHERKVPPYEGMLAKCRPTRGVALARKSDGNQPGGAAIQSMQRPNVRPRATHSDEIGADTGEHAVVTRPSFCGNGEEARRFVDDREVLILVRYGKPETNGLRASAIPVIEDRLGSVDSLSRVSDDLRADIHLPGFDRVLSLASRKAGFPDHAQVQTLATSLHQGQE